MDSLWLDVERLLEGVTNDGWYYLNDNLIVAYYRAPLEWISLMKRIAVVVEYGRAAKWGDVSMEEEISEEEEEDTKEEIESKEDDSN